MPNIKDQELALATTIRAKRGASCRWCGVAVKAWDCCQSFGRWTWETRGWYCCPECGESQQTSDEARRQQHRLIAGFLMAVIVATLLGTIFYNFG